MTERGFAFPLQHRECVGPGKVEIPEVGLQTNIAQNCPKNNTCGNAAALFTCGGKQFVKKSAGTEHK